MKDAVRDTVARFVKKEIVPSVDALDRYDSDPGRIHRAMEGAWDSGIASLPLPESLGGMGWNPPVVGSVLETVAGACPGAAALLLFHFGGMVPFLLAKGGVEVLEGLSSGAGLRWMATGWYSSPGGMADPSGGIGAAEVTAWGVPGARTLTVYAEGDGRAAFSLVETTPGAVQVVERLQMLGLRACPVSTVRTERPAAGGNRTLSLPLEEGGALLRSAHAVLDGLIASIAAGNARGAFSLAWAYAHERYQGGDVIINLPIVQGLLGKVLSRAEASSAFAERALTEAFAGRYRHAALAKAFATETCEWACSDAVQVFGGNGYMRDYGAEKHLRDAKALCTLGGSNPRMLQGFIRDHKGAEGIA